MSLERRARADALLAEALDRDEAEREAFVRQECGGDEELVAFVLELLHDAEAPDDLVRPGELWERAVEALDGPSVAAGDVFGSWEVVEALGAGGMAEVFLVRRVAGDFEQVAALKLIKRGVDTDEVVRRFRQERQILASLEHPNIARVLDGGISGDGRPYFVMERVDGEPIDARCARDGASTELRLRRFVDVCRAVEHAHRKLVVHRDLKPSNILVDERGQVKLLDFGIAKLLEPGAGTQPVLETRAAVRVMTPEYASPEQVRGEPVTTSGDVYQLGLVLYELLTGSRAQDLRGASPAEIERIVCERTPPRPSTVAGARGGLRGDLDNIVLKALRKEPDARYPSVAALVDDVERHLDGRPVAARRPTVAYRLGRFASRHKVATVAAALVLVSIVGGLVATARQARIAARERDTARSVSDFLIETFEVADPSEARGSSVTARELLDSAALRLESLEGEPEVQARMQDVIGRVYMSLGLYETSRRLLSEALETRRARAAGPDAEVAESLDHVGKVLTELGTFGEAEKQLREALAMQRTLHGEASEEAAVSLRSLSRLAHLRDDLPGAEALLLEALAIQKALHGDKNAEVAGVLNDLGSLRLQRGEIAAAAETFEQTLDIRRSVLRKDHPDLAETLNSLGMVEQNRNALDRAEGYYREALDIRTRVLGPRHAYTATARNNLASLLYQKGDYAAAAPIFRETLEQRKETLGPDHVSVATSMTNLGVVLITLGDLDGAEPLYRDALRIRIAKYGEGHRLVATTRYYLARLLRDRGQAAEAEALMRRSLPEIPETDSNRPALCLDLGEMLMAQGRLDEAGKLLEDAVRMHAAVDGKDHWRTAAARSARGEWRARNGDRKSAEEDLRFAWGVLEPRPEEDARRRAAQSRMTAYSVR